jgi:N utilization substance protein A
MNKEFFLALDALVEEKGMDRQMLITTLENALALAYKRQFNVQGTVRLKMNPDKFAVKFMMVKTIVSEVVDPENEITLEEAKTHKKSYKLGDTYEQEFVPKQFGRIAAQTARQVVMQKLREAERDNTIAEFEDKENEIQNCIIRSVENKTVFVEIGGAQVEGLLLPQDQVPNETYNVNDVIKVYVKRVRNDGRNAQILVSRTAPGLVKKLFENEVPEIKQGLIEIKAVAREAGARGGTVVHAKGTGSKYSNKFFGISIAEEKEMIYIVAGENQKKEIMRAIMDNAGIDSEAHTIVFSLPVSDTAGLRLLDPEE